MRAPQGSRRLPSIPVHNPAHASRRAEAIAAASYPTRPVNRTAQRTHRDARTLRGTPQTTAARRTMGQDHAAPGRTHQDGPALRGTPRTIATRRITGQDHAAPGRTYR